MLGITEIITIWNRYRNSEDKDAWQRFIVPVKCKYDSKIIRLVRGGSSAGDTTTLSNVQIVIIPFTELYSPVEDWRRGENFTLQVGDLVALGEYYTDITGVSPFRESEVRESLKPNAFQIKILVDNTRNKNGKHWRIEGI